MPFLELIHRAAGVHRAHNDPSMVQYVLMMNGSFGRRWLVGWLVGGDASRTLLFACLQARSGYRARGRSCPPRSVPVDRSYSIDWTIARSSLAHHSLITRSSLVRTTCAGAARCSPSRRCVFEPSHSPPSPLSSPPLLSPPTFSRSRTIDRLLRGDVRRTVTTVASRRIGARRRGPRQRS